MLEACQLVSQQEKKGVLSSKIQQNYTVASSVILPWHILCDEMTTKTAGLSLFLPPKHHGV